MIATSFLVVFLAKGTDEVMTMSGITNSFFSQVVTGVMFLMIIGCEFFINYRVMFRHHARTESRPVAASTVEATPASLGAETPAGIAPESAGKEENK